MKRPRKADWGVSSTDFKRGPMKKLIQMILTQIFVCGIMVAPSRAADPITGTWKLDVQASKFVAVEQAPREQTESYKELASGEVELTLARIAKDGTQSM